MKVKKRGIYEKIINFLLDILIFVFGLILIVSIYNNIQIKILGNEYSSFFGYSTFEVQTGSMADAINPGDWIVVKISKKIKLDDVITYSKDGEFITHRVVESYKSTYITKGDANNSKDEPITKSQIVGKVVKVLPGFGIIRRTFFNPIVLITLIITLYSVSYVLRTSVKKQTIEQEKRFNYREKIDGFITAIIKRVKSVIVKNNNLVESNATEDVDLGELDVDLDGNDELKIEIPEVNEEDMDKTLYFRMVSVDKLELDNTYQKIADNELNLKKNKTEEDTENVLENENLDVIKEKVDLIQNRRKKFKNIIDKAVFIKKEEINEIIVALTGNENNKLNEPTIRDAILTAYIDVKYYNFCGNVNVEYNKKNMLSKIDSEIKKIGENLVSNYKGSDTKYKEKVEKYVNIYLLINSLEQSNLLISELQVKRELYKNKITNAFKEKDITSLDLNNMVNDIIKIQKLYQGVINYIFDKLNTNTFNLSLNKIVGKKNFFAVSLKHNISFSKVYSDYIVDKTYTEGIIAEDKVIVLLNLLFMNIIKDMFSMGEVKKYFIYIPNSMYVKPNKLDKIFKLFDDEYAKNSIVVVVEYNDLVKYKKQITSLKKKGYRFAVVFDSETKIKGNEQSIVNIVDYLFIDKKVMNYNIISSIPDDLEKSIINDDIISKLGSLGGE